MKRRKENACMIEMVYRQEKPESEKPEGTFKLPKNIKQIGDGETDIQVYMEDNVALYLDRIPDETEAIRYGVLLGSVRVSYGYTYIFINGAVDVREVFDNTVLFGDDIWTALNDDISRYFKGLRVVGWFLSQPMSNTSQNVWIKKMHINNFAGMDKVFFRIDRDEGEEAFYYYGKERMEKLSCYHIYYEKNNNMVDYIESGNADFYLRKARSSEIRGGIINKANEGDKKSGREGEEEAADNNYDSAGKRHFAFSLPRMASMAVICALVATLGVMGANGQLNNLAEGFKNMVKGIVDSDDDGNGGSGIISVNGVPTGKPEETADKNTEESDTSSGQGENNTDSSQETTSDNDNNSTDKEQPTTEDVTASVEPAPTKEYTVKKGDTLYKICIELYGDTKNMEAIIKLNNLENPDDIHYGKNLIVP